ncbi:915_t:CDS:2, partial [Entrophospora sp. SA101]
QLKIIPTSKDNNQNNNNSPSLSFVEEVPSVGELWNMSKKERKKLEKKNIKVKPPEQQQYVINDKDVNKSSLDELASLDDDEEFPSVEELLNRAIPPKKECEKKNNIVELLDQQQEQEQSEPELPDYDVLKDETLSIPGELVLAYSLRKYYPAKIIGYQKPGKYHVLFCDGSKTTLGRNKFYTIYEKGFVTCNLGEIVMEKEDPDYEDPELIATILDLEPTLSDVLLGNDKLAWRYDYFVKGKKKRQLLASRVSQGPFNQSEFGLIAKVLRHMYVPDVAKAIDKKDNIVKPSELIILIMKEDGLSYKEADYKMTDGYEDLRWVETIMSSRRVFGN